MKISTSELKRFKNNSSFIKKNSILPILGYLKFENGTITKTNLHSFIEQKMNFKGEPFLVPEMNLFNFLARSTEQYIDVYVKGTECTISDGKQPFVKVQTEEIKNFPSTPTPDEEEFELDNDVLCAVNYASNFPDYMDAPDAKGHVFIGGSLVAGMNLFIGYNQRFNQKLPNIVLLKDVAMVIGKFNTAKHLQNEKYDFFDTDDSRYGFIKSVYPFVDLTRFNNIKKDEWSSFQLDKEELINFSETCISQTPERGLMASMSVKGNKLLMSMNEPNYKISVNHSAEITVGKDLESKFDFSPIMMTTLLKNTPDKEVTVYSSGSTLHITGETGGVALIQKMVINTN